MAEFPGPPDPGNATIEQEEKGKSGLIVRDQAPGRFALLTGRTGTS